MGIYCMTSWHVSISPPSVPCHQATISLAWSKYIQCPMATSPHAFSYHIRFTPSFDLFYFFRGRTGGRGWIHAVFVWCFGRCLLRHAHCGPPHPPHILLLLLLPCFWTPSIVRWLPTASVPHVCHWLDYSMKKLEWTLTLNMSCISNQKTVLPLKKSQLVVLQHLHVDFYDHSIRFLAVEGRWLLLFWQ